MRAPVEQWERMSDVQTNACLANLTIDTYARIHVQSNLVDCAAAKRVDLINVLSGTVSFPLNFQNTHSARILSRAWTVK